MKPCKQSKRVEAAGFVVQLNFHDPKQYSGIRIPFPPPAGQKNVAAVIDIYSPKNAKKERIRHVSSRKPAITGEGEYNGTFNIHSLTGRIIIGGRNPGTILLNFLTQVFSELVLADNGILLHSACVIKNNKAYIFYGISGAGKSTVCRFSPGCAIASDDLTALRIIHGRFRAWGIPQLDRFPPPPSHGPYPVKGLFLLKKGPGNRLVSIHGSTAIATALTIKNGRFDSERIGKMLELLAKLTDHVPSYELQFRKDSSFWKCIDRKN